VDGREIAHRRLHNQHLSGPPLADPVAVVRHLCAVQAQEYAPAKWGLAQRTSARDVVWLEQGRTELLRALGVSYREIEATGLFVVLSDLRVRYHAAARYDDLVLLRAILEGRRSRQLSFAYELRLGATGALLVTARSEHIVVSRATGRPTRLPPELLAALG